MESARGSEAGRGSAMSDERRAMLSRDGLPPLLVKRLTPGAKLPVRADEGAVGYDLHADLSAMKDGRIIIQPCLRGVVPTGLAVAVPPGTYGRIAPRSGLAANRGIDVLAGVVDRSYRGQVKVVLQNHDTFPFTIEHGDRIAQLVLEKCETPDVREVEALDDTARGGNGFGSSGT